MVLKNSANRKLLTSCLAAGAVIAGVSIVQAQAQTSDSDLEAQISELSSEVAALSSAVSTLNATIENLNSTSPEPSGRLRQIYSRKDLSMLGIEYVCASIGEDNCAVVAENACTALGHSSVIRFKAVPEKIPAENGEIQILFKTIEAVACA